MVSNTQLFTHTLSNRFKATLLTIIFFYVTAVLCVTACECESVQSVKNSQQIVKNLACNGCIQQRPLIFFNCPFCALFTKFKNVCNCGLSQLTPWKEKHILLLKQKDDFASTAAQHWQQHDDNVKGFSSFIVC